MRRPLSYIEFHDLDGMCFYARVLEETCGNHVGHESLSKHLQWMLRKSDSCLSTNWQLKAAEKGTIKCRSNAKASGASKDIRSAITGSGSASGLLTIRQTFIREAAGLWPSKVKIPSRRSVKCSKQGPWSLSHCYGDARKSWDRLQQFQKAAESPGRLATTTAGNATVTAD